MSYFRSLPLTFHGRPTRFSLLGIFVCVFSLILKHPDYFWDSDIGTLQQRCKEYYRLAGTNNNDKIQQTYCLNKKNMLPAVERFGASLICVLFSRKETDMSEGGKGERERERLTEQSCHQ